MKRILLFIFVSCNLIFASAQTKEPKMYIAFDNSKFIQGDSIFIGFNSGYQKFQYIVQYFYGEYNKGYKQIDDKFVWTKHKILDIYKDKQKIWDTSAYVVEVGEKGFFGERLYININQAIKYGEIILSQSPNSLYNSQIQYYSDTVAFLFQVKQSLKLNLDFSLEYLCRFNSKVYGKYKQDEFELDNQKQIASENLKNQISKINDTTIYYLNLKLNFDNYDFSSMAFPIEYKDSYTIINSADYYKFPYTDLVFVNQKEFSMVQVNKDVANGFIKRKKDIYGNVDRTAFAKVYFKNIAIKSNSPALKVYLESNRKKYMFAEINRIEFFDFENRKYNFIGQINSNQ